MSVPRMVGPTVNKFEQVVSDQKLGARVPMHHELLKGFVTKSLIFSFSQWKTILLLVERIVL